MENWDPEPTYFYLSTKKNLPKKVKGKNWIVTYMFLKEGIRLAKKVSNNRKIWIYEAVPKGRIWLGSAGTFYFTNDPLILIGPPSEAS